MSAPAMPLAPKLACRTVSLGAACACARQTYGAAKVAAAAFIAARRVIFDMTNSGRVIGETPTVRETVAVRNGFPYATREHSKVVVGTLRVPSLLTAHGVCLLL